MARKDLKRNLEENPAPDTFGVYYFYNEKSEVIYVGKSVNMRRRMQQYLTPSRKKKNRKRRTIVAEVLRVKFETCTDEKSALLRENELIQELTPKFNTSGAFSFLYPIIGARFSDRRLAVVRTTIPENYEQFELFGAFRDRHLTKEMFGSLEYLLSIVGHREPPQRLTDIPESDYTKRLAFREVREDYWPLIRSFLSGKDDKFLGVLCEHLLSYPSALANANKVEECLKYLKEFFIWESQKLFLTCQSVGRENIFIEQSQRDALFIKAKL